MEWIQPLLEQFGYRIEHIEDTSAARVTPGLSFLVHASKVSDGPWSWGKPRYDFRIEDHPSWNQPSVSYHVRVSGTEIVMSTGMRARIGRPTLESMVRDTLVKIDSDKDLQVYLSMLAVSEYAAVELHSNAEARHRDAAAGFVHELSALMQRYGLRSKELLRVEPL